MSFVSDGLVYLDDTLAIPMSGDPLCWGYATLQDTKNVKCHVSRFVFGGSRYILHHITFVYIYIYIYNNKIYHTGDIVG